jgi:hypothetical protein
MVAMTNKASTGSLALLALSLAGCYATWDVSPRELQKLDGYRAPQRVELQAKRGKVVSYGEDTTLVLHAGSTATEEHLDAADLDAERRVLRGVDHERKPVALAIENIDRVEVKELSTGGTVGLTVGVVTGAATVGVGAWLAYQLSRPWGGGWIGSGGFGLTRAPSHARAR